MNVLDSFFIIKTISYCSLNFGSSSPLLFTFLSQQSTLSQMKESQKN
jgi:hypothetical protein